jgi:hypothetical protein
MRRRARGRQRSGSDRRGEVAAFDIVLFVPLLVVATLFLYAMLSINPVIVDQNYGGTAYASSALQSLLFATAPNATLCVGNVTPSLPTDPCHAFNSDWGTGTVQDYSMGQLIVLHLSLLQAVAPGPARAQLEQLLESPGWVGYVINDTASQVAMGSPSSANAQTFQEYYLEYQNTSVPSVPCSISSACVYAGFGAAGTSGTVYSASATLTVTGNASSFDTVVLGVWG